MTGEIVNLRRYRKAKARIERAGHAAENRVLFGRTKGERERTRTEAEIETARLDALERVPSPDDQGQPGP